MPTVDATFFKLAVELAAPSLATGGLLNNQTGVAAAANIVVNAYNVVIVAQDKLANPKGPGAMSTR